MSEDELVLIGKAQGGDIVSFEQLIRPHQTKLYRIALSITGNTEDAEDVFQEAVLHAYRAIAKFRGDASFSTWLYRITMNVGRNWVRSQRRASSERFVDSLPILSEAYSTGPEEIYMSRAQADQVHQALLSLPDHYRETLVLRHYENLSYEQIAEILCVPIGTVRSRLAQGRKCLLYLLNYDELSAQKHRR